MTSSPTPVRSHGMKTDLPGHLWSKYECFLMSGWWDILHSSCFNLKLWSNSTNGTKLRTDERKNKNYIPLRINAGGYNDSPLTISVSCSMKHWIQRTFLWFASWTNQCLVHILLPVTDNCPSWTSKRLIDYCFTARQHKKAISRRNDRMMENEIK